MHVVNDFRGVLQMTLNVLNRKAEAEPTIGDIAYELKRSGGYMVDLVSELEAHLASVSSALGCNPSKVVEVVNRLMCVLPDHLLEMLSEYHEEDN